MELINKVITKIKEGMLQEIYIETKWMYQYAKKYKYQIGFYIFLGILTAAMGLGSSKLSKNVMDSIYAKNGRDVLLWGALMGVLSITTIFVNAKTSMISAKISIKVNNEIQAEVFDKILITDWISMQEFHSGDLLNRLNSDVNTVSSSILGWVPTLITSSVQFLVALVALL